MSLKNFQSLQWVRYRNKEIFDMSKLNDLIEDPNVVVTFNDKNLEKAVRDKIEKPSGDITKAELRSVTELNLWNENITDLQRIENLMI